MQEKLDASMETAFTIEARVRREFESQLQAAADEIFAENPAKIKNCLVTTLFPPSLHSYVLSLNNVILFLLCGSNAACTIKSVIFVSILIYVASTSS